MPEGTFGRTGLPARRSAIFFIWGYYYILAEITTLFTEGDFFRK